MIHHLTKAVKQLNSRIPEKLPQGVSEFNNWVEDISELSGLPVNDKLKTVIGHLILQMPPTVAFVSKNRIANLVRKAASNQVALEIVRSINEKEEQKTDTKESTPTAK